MSLTAVSRVLACPGRVDLIRTRVCGTAWFRPRNCLAVQAGDATALSPKECAPAGLVPVLAAVEEQATTPSRRTALSSAAMDIARQWVINRTPRQRSGSRSQSEPNLRAWEHPPRAHEQARASLPVDRRPTRSTGSGPMFAGPLGYCDAGWPDPRALIGCSRRALVRRHTQPRRCRRPVLRSKGKCRAGRTTGLVPLVAPCRGNLDRATEQDRPVDRVNVKELDARFRP